jgi:hypothetical protein
MGSVGMGDRFDLVIPLARIVNVSMRSVGWS